MDNLNLNIIQLTVINLIASENLNINFVWGEYDTFQKYIKMSLNNSFNYSVSDKLSEIVNNDEAYLLNSAIDIDNKEIIVNDINKNNTSLVEYKGILNIRNNCFMNSVIQMLFHIDNLRDELILSKFDSNKNCLNNLINIFLDLKNSKDAYINPIVFINNYKSKKIDIKQQNDAYEFLFELFENLGNDLNYSNHKELISNYFAINLNISYSLLCGHKFSKQENFLTLELDIHNCNDLNKALNSFFSLEYMTNNNKIYCSVCLSKFDGHRLSEIITIPKFLIIILKRFIYDTNINERLKNNKYFEFPLYIDLRKYINSKEKTKINTETDYNLKEVIIHEGTAKHGHYFILIKDSKSQKWIKINDKFIDLFDITNLKNFAFGGYDNYYKNEIDSNAYMIVYEKINIDNKSEIKDYYLEKNNSTISHNNLIKFEDMKSTGNNNENKISIESYENSEESEDKSNDDYSVNQNMDNLLQKFDKINIENSFEIKKISTNDNIIKDILKDKFKPKKRKNDELEDSKKENKKKDKGIKKKWYNYPKD